MFSVSLKIYLYIYINVCFQSLGMEISRNSCIFIVVEILCIFGVDCRGLVHLFCYRGLQMWSADCRRFTNEKTNSTLFLLFKKR
ncbi:hypothetical protein Hanom_Chr17g01532681 [Helianthus anomalus]